MGPSEKKARKLAYGVKKDSFSVHFESQIRKIAAISSDFAEITTRFLCTPDCVAEGREFELPVRFPGKLLI
jgi:hypothetical protein